MSPVAELSPRMDGAATADGAADMRNEVRKTSPPAPAELPRYQWQAPPEADEALVALLAARCELSPPVARLLVRRGIVDPERARKFLSPSLADIAHPFTLPGLEKAAATLLEAIRAQKRLTVFGDFDADGVVATALLTDVLRALGGQVTPFLPDREKEGYGLTPEGLERCLRECRPELLITVDCGINAAAEIARLHQAGVAVVVTDHHAPGAILPPCPVVNPRMPGTPAAMQSLCGAGVAFKLAHGLRILTHPRPTTGNEPPDLRPWLDAVALATVADVVPLVEENRILVSAGLRRMHRRPRVGLRELIRRTGIPGLCTSHHLGFMLGPRINASGRMRSAMTALNLVLTGDPDEARRQAALLEQLNAERRRTEAETLTLAQKQLHDWFDPARHGAIVAGGPDWHAGTIGIVASRLCDRHQRPAAVVALASDGSGRGSARAGEGYNIVELFQACDGLLARFGGHARAGGFQLRPGAFEDFREAFSEACRGQSGRLTTQPGLQIDGWWEFGDIESLWGELQRLEPFGEGHPRPCWGLRACRPQRPRRIGADGAHLSMTLLAPGQEAMRAVWFRGGAWLPAIQAHGETFDLAATLEESHFNGQRRLEWHIHDMRPAQAAAPR